MSIPIPKATVATITYRKIMKRKKLLSILQLAKFVNNLECVVQPLPVYSAPVTGREVGMVVASLDTVLAKIQSDLLTILTRKTVDDS